jgi:hypothetical protein
MPNWCFNIVTFTHDDSAMIKKIEDSFKSEPGLFSGFFPCPDDGDDWNWYHWCNANWGTKWDVSEADGNYIQDQSENSIQLYFDTAWSPPIEFYEKMLQLGFHVCAYYFEPGMCFTGSWEDGDDECYESFADDIDKNVPSELVDMFGIKDWYEHEKDIEEAQEQWDKDNILDKK